MLDPAFSEFVVSGSHSGEATVAADVAQPRSDGNIARSAPVASSETTNMAESQAEVGVPREFSLSEDSTQTEVSPSYAELMSCESTDGPTFVDVKASLVEIMTALIPVALFRPNQLNLISSRCSITKRLMSLLHFMCFKKPSELSQLLVPCLNLIEL